MKVLRSTQTCTSRLLLLCLSLLLLPACSDTEEQVAEVKPRMVQTQVINLRQTDNYLEFPGQVSASQTAQLGFRIAGKLSQMNVREGEEVAKDTLLAALDDTDYAIQLEARQADYDRANADFTRGKQLIEKNLLARADFDKLTAQRTSALSSLNAAKQNMIYTQLKAPFDGIIGKQHVENFEDVNVMQSIYTIQDLSILKIKVALPETVMISAREGKNARVRALFDSIPGREFPLVVDSASTEADPGSKTFEVTFTMPSVEGVNILPGMSATVRATPSVAEEETNIIVPAHAVIADTLGKAVFVVENIQDNQGTVARRSVETGLLGDSGIVILSGLNEGDHVITAGMSRVNEGLVVRLSKEWTK
jgi:RND family efflux transporter MFP subunit